MIDDTQKQERLRHRDMLADASKTMIKMLYSNDQTVSCLSGYHSYDMNDLLVQARLGTAGEIACSDYSEMVNRLNAWIRHARAFSVWIKVMNQQNDGDRWSVYLAFVEPLAFFCLHQPAAFKDAVMRYATHAIHAGNVAMGYTEDRLPEDKKKIKHLRSGSSNHFLSRREQEEQLQSISTRWEAAPHLSRQLQELDNESYRVATGDWRNESAHYIPPRIYMGTTRWCRREMDFYRPLVERPDGIFSWIEDKEKFVVSYRFGGDDALTCEKAHDLNIEQLQIARRVMTACDVLLEEIARVVGPRGEDSLED